MKGTLLSTRDIGKDFIVLANSTQMLLQELPLSKTSKSEQKWERQRKWR
jgi:hypothetical protein